MKIHSKISTTCATILVVSSLCHVHIHHINAYAFSSSSSSSLPSTLSLPSTSRTRSTTRRATVTTVGLNSHSGKNEHDHNHNHYHNQSHDHKTNKSMTYSRRSAFSKTAQIATTAATTILSTTSPANADTEDFLSNLNPFTPADRKTVNNYNYRPAPRPYSYLVDSTIPPTLVPFQSNREAAILKNIGMGSGTPKAPVVEERLNLNNMMNKGVFGTIDFVRDVTGLNNNDNDGSEFEEGNNNSNGSEQQQQQQQQAKTATGSKSGTTKSKIYNQSFVFLGLDYNDESGDDTALAINIIETIMKPRRGYDTAIALSFVPTSLQRDLNDYMTGVGVGVGVGDGDGEEALINTLLNNGQIPMITIQNQLPLIRYAKRNRIKLIASAPENVDLLKVRKDGLQSVDPSQYVSDVEGFIRWTQEPKNKLYTERSLLKDWVPLSLSSSSSSSSSSLGGSGDVNGGGSASASDVESSPGGFFAEKILLHETIATRMANYAFRDVSNTNTNTKNTMVINVGPIADVRFLGGPNGRIARICKAIAPNNNNNMVDDDAVTTILLNPSAKETLSQSKFLRLEIGTGPSTIEYQTKVADYLWFSSMPKVNMLPRLMNG